MNFLSVCSGIEAASVAWEPIGFKALAYSEIESFPSSVLKHHFPLVPNLGDMTKFKEWKIEQPVDILVGGTPCQSFSIAGLRRGIEDPRGNLMLTYGAIAGYFKPTWVVWENVPGVLSSNRGRDFGTFLGMLGELGYGFAYRILDAQFYGVAQRRRRVFVVGHLGDWRRAASVLFEPESLCWYPKPSRKKREEIAGSAAFCFEPRSPDGYARVIGNISPTLNRMGGGQREPCIAFPAQMSGTQVAKTKNLSPALCARNQTAIAFEPGIMSRDGGHVYQEIAGTLRKEPGDNMMAVQSGQEVRRLTPRECERLQGFPDDWTLVPFRGKPAADGPRYKAIGNSMAVPVMHWIGERIKKVASEK